MSYKIKYGYGNKNENSKLQDWIEIIKKGLNYQEKIYAAD